MPQKYVKKKPGPSWSKEAKKEAVKTAMGSKERITKVAESPVIPRQTLGKKLKLLSANKEVEFKPKNYGCKRVFNEDQENILAKTLLENDLEMVGLSSWEVRKVAFELAKNII